MLLLDDTERDLIRRVLADANDADRDLVALWQTSTTDPAPIVVHGLTDSGRLIALPPSTKACAWMVQNLDALVASTDNAGRVFGWAPRWYVEHLARRIERPDVPAGEAGSVRVGADDLRILLDAAESAAGRPPKDAADGEWIAAIADVVDRVGLLAAMVWTGDQG